MGRLARAAEQFVHCLRRDRYRNIELDIGDGSSGERLVARVKTPAKTLETEKPQFRGTPTG
jgi:hypothetical protein